LSRSIRVLVTASIRFGLACSDSLRDTIAGFLGKGVGMIGAKTSLVRPRGAQARVTNIELFFDLVFVFAVTQLSHSFLRNLTPAGGGHVLILFLGVWWAWICTSWVTNWLDPERIAVRLVLLTLMAAGLVLSASIPEAFEEHGLSFALAFVAIQVGRSLFMLWALGNSSPANTRNFQRITLWFVASGAFWIVGGLAEPEPRLWLWIAAVAFEYAGPAAGFFVPGLGRSTTGDWNVEGGHIAERCSGFIIIALGESIVVTGATFSELSWDMGDIPAFVLALVASIIMWWIYFDTGAERGAHRISHAADPGRLARLAYTYLHLPIVAGIILTAVANELLLEHPEDTGTPLDRAVILGGPLLFLLGNLLFKRATIGRWPLSHLVGVALFIIAAAFLRDVSFMGQATVATLVLALVTVWETVSLRRGWIKAR
jgi:low temperature requirement protein LtrA